MPTQSTSQEEASTLERLSIDELSTLAGVTPRTVRYYIAEGLVDRPEGEKRGAHYLRRHLEQLLLIRRWTDAGLSLDRVRELLAGAPEDPTPRRAAPGSVEVWSRVTVADGLEVQVEPGRASLTPEQVRNLVRGITALYRQVRGTDAGERSSAQTPTPSTIRENNDE
jgi:DNA-binding transcriptional MerR regulator